MIYPATQLIADRFDGEGFRYRIDENEHSSVVLTGITCDNTSIDIQYISTDNENDVTVRVYRLVRYPEEKYGSILEAINELNMQFRFVRFIADKDDHSVDVYFDFPLSTSNVDELAVEMFHRLPNICDEAFPQLMKVIWGS